MQSISDYPDSYYVATAKGLIAYPPLTESVKADVCVIGGGFTGLLSALNLAEKGYKVALLETHKIGWGASGRNGGQAGDRRLNLLQLQHNKNLGNQKLIAFADHKKYMLNSLYSSRSSIEC